MFSGSDLPDFGKAIVTLGWLALAGVILGGYELIRLAIWLYHHIHVS